MNTSILSGNEFVGILENFVLHNLSDSIGVISQDREHITIKPLFNQIEEIFNGINAAILEQIINDTHLKIFALDTKMCAMALWHNGCIDLPNSLSHTLETLCKVTGDVRILTYEDIILANPAGNPRTFFSKRDIGRSEVFFYESHQQIENAILHVPNLLKNAIATSYCSEDLVESINTLMIGANYVMQKLMKELDTGHFNIFRNYLGSVANLKGPSGAFSGTYPLIDLYWRGSSGVFYENKDRYIADNMYFPSFQRDDILRLAKTNHPSIISLKDADVPGFRGLHDVLTATMKNFRQRHLSAVKKHIPDVFDDKALGTMGDSHTGTYLKNSLEQTKTG